MLALSIKLAFQGLLKKPLSRAFTAAVVAFILVVSSLIGILLHSFTDAIGGVKDQYFVTAYLSPQVSEDKEADVAAAVKKIAGVEDVTLVGREKFIANLSKNFPQLSQDLPVLESDAIPRYLRVQSTRTDVEAFKGELMKLPGVSSVDLNRERFEGLLGALTTLRRFALLLLLGALAALAGVLTNHYKLDTIHRSQVIETLSLLGARPAQVRMPFVVEGVIEGLLGGLFAAGALLVGGKMVDAQVTRLFETLGYRLHRVDLASIAALLILAGAASGAAASVWAVAARAGAKRVKIKFLTASLMMIALSANAADAPSSEAALTRVRSEITRVENELLATRDAGLSEKAQLAKIHKLLELQRREIKLSESRVTELTKNLSTLSERKQKLLDDIAAGKKAASSRLRELDKLIASDPVDAHWLQDFDALHQRGAYLSAVLKKNLESVQELRKNADNALALELRILEEKAQVDYYVQELRENNEVLAANEKIQRDVLVNRRANRLEALKNLRELRGAERELSDMIRRIDQKRSSPVPQRQMSGGLALMKGRLPWPTEGSLLSGFGRSYNKSTNLFTFQKGWLLGAGGGVEVKAIAAGKVAYAGPLKNYGFIVILEHPGQYFTLYGQLGKMNVSEGSEIAQGSPVGISSNEPVYFEIRNRNVAMNPSQWLVSAGPGQHGPRHEDIKEKR